MAFQKWHARLAELVAREQQLDRASNHCDIRLMSMVWSAWKRVSHTNTHTHTHTHCTCPYHHTHTHARARRNVQELESYRDRPYYCAHLTSRVDLHCSACLFTPLSLFLTSTYSRHPLHAPRKILTEENTSTISTSFLFSLEVMVYCVHADHTNCQSRYLSSCQAPKVITSQ